MSTSRLFILGIDGVDFAIAKEQDLLLKNTAKWNLEEYPDLHTLRIWPSMFTGSVPHQNNELPDPLMQSKSEESGRFEAANWTSRNMRLLSKASHLVLPQAIRSRLGKYLQRHGVIKAGYDPVNWSDTVFDGILSKVINLPTYNPLPVQRELKQGWKTKIRTGNAGLEELDRLARQERSAVWSEIEEAIDRGYDLTWAYIYSPDIFGHVDINYSYPTAINDVCNEIITPLRDKMAPEDQLVITSDHGMIERDGVGEHRPPGWFTTTFDSVDAPTTPKDVRLWIESVVGAQSQDKEDILRDLGYI